MSQTERRGFEPRPFDLLPGGGFSPQGPYEGEVADDAPGGGGAPGEDAAEHSAGDEAQTYTADEIEALERAAFERGVEQAVADAQAIERAHAAVEAAAGAIERELATRPSSNREAMVELIAEIATRWVGAELRLDPMRVAEQLERALEAVADDTAHTIHLHPDDLSAIQAGVEPGAELGGGDARLVLEGNPTLARGEFQIDLARGVIDGRLEAARQELVERLTEAFEAPLPDSASDGSDPHGEPAQDGAGPEGGSAADGESA